MKNNRTLITIILLLVFYQTVFSQEESAYDKAMLSLAKNVAKKVKEKNKLKVAVWYFNDSFGKKNTLGDYIGKDFSIHFTNASAGINVIDRDHLEQIMKEHHLNTEGYIDSKTAKQINMIIAADAIITGTVDVGLHFLRVRIKIIDTQTGLQIAAALKNIPIDEQLKYILEDSGIVFNKNTDKNKKRILKNEKYNNPTSTNVKCESLNTGDYCFKNTTNNTYEIKIYGKKRGHFYGIMKTINVSKQENNCFYDLPMGTYSYIIVKNNNYLNQIKGGFRVEKCKSLTKLIR